MSVDVCHFVLRCDDLANAHKQSQYLYKQVIPELIEEWRKYAPSLSDLSTRIVPSTCAGLRGSAVSSASGTDDGRGSSVSVGGVSSTSRGSEVYCGFSPLPGRYRRLQRLA